ncbi:hypothetical protein Mal48_34730 [Thalassoglobus polymorphus]|uniref:Uncharacterized protein n=1 Tax=Thalassoglobus polymorphus TaxID=2527994 RepID=A0A517QRH4_9PLAN|nr:hypothetical protein Mal48_34730 [Thalassoglobus polymorphus]
MMQAKHLLLAGSHGHDRNKQLYRFAAGFATEFATGQPVFLLRAFLHGDSQ